MKAPLLRFLACAIVGLAPALSAAVDAGATPTTTVRPVSPRVAALLKAASRDLVQVIPTEAPPSTAALAPVPRAGTIVRLPSYIVRERPPPTAYEVMVKAEREKLAMQTFLGDESGLERVLNMFSVAGFWAKIPGLGKYPFIVGQFSGRDAGPAVGPRTNEQRALELYEQGKMAERWAQLAGLTPASKDKLKPE